MKTLNDQEINEIQKLNEELNERLQIEAPKDGSAPVEYHKKKRIHNSNHKVKKKRRKKRTFKDKLLLFFEVSFVVLSCMVFILSATLFTMIRRGKAELMKEKEIASEFTGDGIADMGDGIVSYQGHRYQLRTDLINILLLGVDQEELQMKDKVPGQHGQSDTIVIASIDSDSGKITLINISRDAMVDVDVYSIEGNYVDTERMQICLSFAYGDGGHKSVENTMKSVSRLMYGVPLHAYAAIDIPSISVLNDAIGGVEVDVLEDLTAQDPMLVEGKHVLLKGGTAVTYIRTRQWGEDAPVDANNYRMRRQKQYITNFIIKAIDQVREDVGIAPSLFKAVQSYMVTDIDANQVAYLASVVAKRNFNEGNIVTVPGQVVRNGDYANFIVDDDGLYELILNNFYELIE